MKGRRLDAVGRRGKPSLHAGRRRGRLARATGFGILGLLVPSTTAPQETPEAKILTVVDHVSGGEVYLSSGTEQGIQVGDTLSVYGGEGAGGDFLGTVVIVSVTERRSVATPVGGAPFTAERADILYLGLPGSLLEQRLQEVAAQPESSVASPFSEEPAGQMSQSAPPKQIRPPIEIRGRASLDMDALQTTTRWGESPEEELQRSFSTPTFRLQARVQNLPGGFQLGTNMRLSHRTSPDDVIQPVTSLRFYQFDLEKRFQAVPAQLHLGRFHNPFDDYSGYWDGMMVHVGEGGLGAGAALGFEPELWNEGISTDRPKFSGFVDYTSRGETAEYSGALSFSALRPTIEEEDRTYFATTHRIRLGDAWIRQRLRLDRSPNGGDWTMTRLQVDATLPLSKTLSIQGGWRRWRPFDSGIPDEVFGASHDRATVGLSFWTLGGGITTDVSLDRPDGGEEARTVSSSFFLRRTPLLGLGFSGMASYWKRGKSTSLILSPEIRRDLGRGQIRAAYRYYATDTGLGEILTHYSDLSVSFPIAGTLYARLGGFVQWGDNFSSNRILASLWKTF
jgi:hypothetical protein